MSATVELLSAALQALTPEHLDIQDDSALHAGHAGARDGGGHYTLTIVSARFQGLSRVHRHRLIYETLGDLMQTKVHALAIRAFTPEEI
ncbi:MULTISPECIES: BolA family transcriptional regulator [Chromobacterium]|uniref:BolA family transcriptional regulator n=1 Tax=Chromobacterium fluminis TaxID=3044269 RepID=A0ABX0L3D6_9NEIS|nr:MULTISPECIES: BolA family protein [Chromobacterium]MCP1291041.1 BolA family transcriptional regulator [Chromobacterium sp. S0633]NHR04152.1 BolA family transcriptional regulator [Chromobacterium haemolyticum]OQS43976.1 BolA family transcriptional regulator [Chromobacterium haemolyticum]PTU65178.1 BolA family transcriptional regulator [Chromobacterium sp. Panama]UJB30937.1 BolA family transcriptional regulator [Chromobacterium sp. Beijing]